MRRTEGLFDPLPGQRVFMEAAEPEILYSGSLGAGKTLVGLEKGLALSQMFPGNEGLIVRKVGADLTSTTLKTWWEEVLPPELIIRHHDTKKWVTIKTSDPAKPSRIWWTGMDRILRVGGTQFGWIFFDEVVEAEEEDWMMLDGRMRHTEVPFHQMMGATNPGAPSHFLYERFVTNGNAVDEETGERIRRIVHANSLDNPYLPASYARRLGRFTGVHRDRFVLGKWVGYEGLVYGEFNPGIHVVADFEVPKAWRRVASIDFGWGNPLSMSWWAMEPSTGTWFQYRQWYAIGTDPVAEGHRFNELNGDDELEAVVVDHDLGARRDFARYAGISTTAAKKDVDTGINKVRARLAFRDGRDGRDDVREVPIPGGVLEFPEGAPGLLFMEGALVMEDPALLALEEKVPMRTTDEFGGYLWAKGAHGTTRDVPRKKNDHGLDEARYFVMHVDNAGTDAVIRAW